MTVISSGSLKSRFDEKACTMANDSFYSIYRHGFIRGAVCIPHVKVADPHHNGERTLALAREAANQQATIALFPELGLSAYSNDDLFHQESLLNGVESALQSVVEGSRPLNTLLIIGAPLRFENKLFNCGIVIYRGKILGIGAKTYLPNYREFYEKRQFCSSRHALNNTVTLLGQSVPFGNNLIFSADNLKGFSFHLEICEDLWAPIPPSSYAALAGATVLTNLSASNITVGKADYRRHICAAQSGKCIAAYLYSAAGQGESTTDLAWDGYALIYENDEQLAESQRFSDEEQIVIADIDCQRLVQDRMRSTSFNDAVREHHNELQPIQHIPFTFDLTSTSTTLHRQIERFPYVPHDREKRDERCFETYNIQIRGLIKRMQYAHLDKLVIGISGGLDSTQALIVAARTMDKLQLPRKNILAYTMPGFATSQTTLNNAHALMDALKISGHEIDIRPACRQMLADIKHPFANNQPIYDVTFENVQAGQRTAHLFRLANHHRAMVLGTGDLSELALGWTTYGVGDHMSHYNVNASLPKTMIQHLIRWIIDSRQFGEDTCRILQSIVDTEISPELVPSDDGKNQPSQLTENHVGPYELQDFNLYYVSRYGFNPEKIAFLGYHAWQNKHTGLWPDTLAPEQHREYDLATIKRWLEVFLGRFFGGSQFKRSCVPNGPKVGSGGSLSPRSDWRAPSDAEKHVWLDDLKKIP